MEDGVNLPLGGNVELECHVGDNLFDFKGASPFHLELFGAIHMKVSCFEPDLISHFPRGKFGGYPFFHLCWAILWAAWALSRVVDKSKS